MDIDQPFHDAPRPKAPTPDISQELPEIRSLNDALLAADELFLSCRHPKADRLWPHIERVLRRRRRMIGEVLVELDSPRLKAALAEIDRYLGDPKSSDRSS
jgi:hypothetical protein